MYILSAMANRLAALVALSLTCVGEAGHAAPAPPATTQAALFPPSADGGFRMEPRPVIDDVFGDANDFRKTIDRFLVLGDKMRKTREEFAHAVQSALSDLYPHPGPKPHAAPHKKCPEAEVAPHYAHALRLGQGYLRTGRELTRHYEQVREFDRLGETAGLTPDYRARVKRVFVDYAALLVDYREMKVAFHDQLADELKFAGCDLDRLVARADAATPRPGDDAWPSPAHLGDAPPGDKIADEKPPAATPPTPPRPTETPQDPTAANRAGILFFVDNTRCQTMTRVFIDGRPLGDVPAATKAAFQASPGPHDLCLLGARVPNQPEAHCGDPGTVRKSYIHEGWMISLRCE